MKAKIISTHKEGSDCCAIRIKLEEKIPYKAGQFMVFKFIEEGKTKMRPYTIMSAPWEGTYEFCVRNAGNVSSDMCSLHEGDIVEVSEPKGKFVLPEEEQKHYLLICNGIGITHMRSLLRTLFENYYSGKGKDTEKPVTLLYGARNSDNAVYDEDMRKLAADKDNFHYHLSYSQAEGKLTGYVQEHLDLVCEETQTAFICGSTAMVKEVKEKLHDKGIDKVLTEFMG